MYKYVRVYLRMYNCTGLYTELSDTRWDFRIMCYHLRKDAGDLRSSGYSYPYK